MIKKFLTVFIFLAISAAVTNANEMTFNELYVAALKSYNQKKYDDSLKDINNALNLAKNDIEKFQALVCKFNNYNIQRKYIESVNTAKDILKLENLNGYQKNQWLHNQLTAYYNAGKNDECIAVCDQLIANKHTEYKDNAYHFKYFSYKRKNDKDKAVATADKYEEYARNLKHPCYYKAKLLQMTSLDDKKEYDKAVSAISSDEAETMPDTMKGEYYNLLGNIYKNQKKYTEAIRAFEKAGQDDYAYQGGYGWYSIGELYCTMNKDNEAIAAFAKVYELPDSHSLHKTIAIVKSAELLNKSGKTDEALEVMEKLNQITNPNMDWLARGKILAGEIFFTKNNNDKARKQFEMVINMKGISADLIKKAKIELEKISKK